MLVRNVINGLTKNQDKNTFQIKIYEKNDSNYAVNITESGMIQDILDRQVKSFCIQNDDKTQLIKQVTIILE